ncbi:MULTISPECIES: hypothetical protein [Clostridium]|jgi:hypothetical protein|uniref:hypothetical protein n=1 Tax=Clostridium TaxID=1485 RepID=UPI001CCC4F65|nr:MULTISPECIES: hypothetical protein [Clostridium]MDK0895348.1 hypothetical protein [Clostridium perfringens]MDU4427650.1 hypothetical protein [Clostridium sp.]MDU7458741.1 hypothetical protein [Clostridium perfringens]UBL05079.1 hypothetical protein KLF33_06855 [Clostridium perfringens]
MKRRLNKLIRIFRKPLILQLKYKLPTEELNKLQDTLDKESNRKIIIVPSYLDVIDY